MNANPASLRALTDVAMTTDSSQRSISAVLRSLSCIRDRLEVESDEELERFETMCGELQRIVDLLPPEWAEKVRFSDVYNAAIAGFALFCGNPEIETAANYTLQAMRAGDTITMRHWLKTYASVVINHVMQ